MRVRAEICPPSLADRGRIAVIEDLEEFRPPGTFLVGLTGGVAFDCENPPKLVGKRMTRVPKIGFIAAHEFQIDAEVSEWKLERCEKEGCDYAFKYKYKVRFEVARIAGLGFSWGVGTATIGWTFHPKRHVKSYETQCICCDEIDAPSRMPRTISRQFPLTTNVPAWQNEGVLAFVAATATLGLGTVTALAHWHHVLAKGFVVSVAALAVLSGLFVLSQALKRD